MRDGLMVVPHTNAGGLSLWLLAGSDGGVLADQWHAFARTTAGRRNGRAMGVSPPQAAAYLLESHSGMGGLSNVFR